ncbi:MAG: LVIVD repeat-containing protein [Candidatus Eisenbacteria bacterium]|nr:hypothetical protein [Candidatus Eisenbacteria bacterium]
MSAKRLSRAARCRVAAPLGSAFLPLLVCLAVTVPGLVRAQCADYAGTFRFLGACDLPDQGNDVAVDGSLAYVVSGVVSAGCTGRLDVFDVSTVGQEGGTPNRIAGIALEGGPVTLAVLADRAYVGASGGELHVVDLSNPSVPVLRTTLYGEGIRDVGAAPGLLYAATAAGLDVYDLADPDSPRRIGTAPLAGPAKSLALSGDFAFVVWDAWGSGGSALSVVDVSEPADPVVRNTMWSASKAFTVAVSGARAFLGGGPRYGGEDGFIDRIDVSDPLHPRPAGSLEDLEHPVHGIAIREGALYASAADSWYHRGGLYVVDVSHAGDPFLVHMERLEFQAFGPCIADGIVYFCEHRSTGGLHFAVAPGDVRAKALGAFSSSSDIYSVDAQADFAYLTDSSPALRVVDLSDPRHPHLAGSVGTPSRGEAVEVQGNVAYVGYSMRALSVVNVSNPQAPQIIGSVPQASSVVDMIASGSWLYTIGWSGMWTIDISNPSSPVTRGHLTIDGDAIALQGAHLYLLGGYGFEVVDVTNPATPVRVGGLATEAGRALAVSGQHAFVVDWDGVEIIDITNPALPVAVGRIDGIENLDSIMGIVVQGDYGYLAGDRMLVFDIRDPVHPVALGGTETQEYSWPRDMVAGDEFVLVAGENLRVFPPQCPANGAGARLAWNPAPAVRVAPNPMRDQTRLELQLDSALPNGAAVAVRVRVLDVTGRPVARLADGAFESGSTYVLRWDGRRDRDGRAAPAGVYWLRVEIEGRESRTARIVKLPNG